MPRITFDSKRGLVQEAGSGVVFNTDTISFTSLPTSTVQAITTTLSSITSPGVYTVTSSVGALTTYLPDPSTIPGGTVIIRSLSPSAHAFTGSSGVAGVNIFAGAVGYTGAVTEGQKLTFPAITGASAALISDGRAYLLAATSGSMSISIP